jgi:hypothetical protein
MAGLPVGKKITDNNQSCSMMYPCEMISLKVADDFCLLGSFSSAANGRQGRNIAQVFVKMHEVF